MSATPISLLRKTFGYSEFRPRQEEIISRVLQRQHTLIVMPTGVGKSLCYQIPALIFEGLTLVISPLISLMQDQVEALRQLGIKAAFLNSSLSPAEFAETAQAVTNGELKLLYLAPEGLFTNRIQTLLQNQTIDSIAIDEAHCISEWGHDFRPEYRQLVELRRAFPDAVFIALTATATPRVQKDILASLDLPKACTIVTSFDRPNLFLQIMAKSNPAGQVIDFLQQHKEDSGIIYCFTRRQVDELSSYLDHIGYSVLPYHAGLDNDTRTENQTRFIRDDVQIIVATIAFGMGIDKPNIRFVIHYDLPQNIESYYQQIGRAGRDGLRADCLLLFSYSDLNKIRYIIDKKESASERRIAAIHLQALVQMAESHVCRRKRLLHYFGQTYDKPNCGMCDNCLTSAPKLQDKTVAAQKFLSCVKRTGERFGAGHIIDILRGSENRKLLNLGHQHLSTYGVGRDYAKPQWRYLAGQFVSLGLLRVDSEYGSLKLTEKAANVLFKDEKVMVVDIEHERQLEIKDDRDSKAGYDRKLFELLRAERKAIADAQGIPPYVIFPDKTLIEMSVRYPQDGITLRSVFGVGEVKNKRYGHRFLQLIRCYCRQHNIDPGKNAGSAAPRCLGGGPGRHLFIGRAFVEGKSIEELQKMYGVKRDTIIKHLTRYHNEIEHLPVKRLEEEVDALVDRKKVMQAFERLGCEALKPIFEHLEEKIPYTELKLCRLLYQYEQRQKENP